MRDNDALVANFRAKIKSSDLSTAALFLYKETLLEVVFKADGWIDAEVKAKCATSVCDGYEV